MEFEDLLNLTVTPKAVASIVGQQVKPTPCAQRITSKLGAAYAYSYWARAVFNTLKPFNAEQSGERGGRGGFMSLPPLPPGEGRGEGSSAPTVDQTLQPTTASPHPSPLPEREGIKRTPLPGGEGTSQFSRAVFFASAASQVP